MFLKRIEISGFKSFKDRTVLNFDHNVVGIVGPNGCGKSNIADAVRWALGEQSQKSLRSGSSRSDIIFNGSRSHSACQIASVSLSFDNSQRVFPVDLEEVEIMRRYYRADNRSVYYINKKQVQLKDIMDLVLDTGLGKDSLSIITQGNIIAFADARPEDRRPLFEEAAGIAKYKRRKKKSLVRLENTQQNLERARDLLSELESRLPELKDQAENAGLYQSLKKKLEQARLFELMTRIMEYKKNLDSLKLQDQFSKKELAANKASTSTLEKKTEEIEREIQQMDQQLLDFQQQLSLARQSQFQLEKQQIIVEERKRMADLSRDLPARKEKLSQELVGLRKQLASMQLDQQDHLAARKELARSLSRIQTKLQSDLSQKEKLYQKERELFRALQKLEARLESSRPKNLSELSKLPGIHGVVHDLISAKPGYETAIEMALGSTAHHMISDTQKDAGNAIEYLKANRLSRMTFLPLDVSKEAKLSDVERSALNQKGVLGLASEYTLFDPIYEKINSRLLGDILVVKDLNTGLEIAKKYKHRLKLVSLDGEVFFKGGALAGGYSSKKADGKKLEQFRSQYANVQKELEVLQQSLDEQGEKKEAIEKKIMESRLDLQKEDSDIMHLRKEIEAMQTELGMLVNVNEQKLEDFSSELESLTETIDSLQGELVEKQNLKQSLLGRQEQLRRELRQKRRQYQNILEQQSRFENEKSRMDALLQAALQELENNFSLSLEKALLICADLEFDQKDFEDMKQTINRLSRQIENLGEVNLQAYRQYEELNDRYSLMKDQIEELTRARQDLLDALDDMDLKMKTEFLDLFNRVNEELEGVFQAMFGGGSARLILSDPDNVLASGIDLEANPPGKKMKGLQSFSGGEKALITISVLFSILKARNVPLCIFDEVEAALDPANVDRFARYLFQFRDQSQFIIITHRQGTMEKCEALYGVTMANDGVSRVLRALLDSKSPDQSLLQVL